MSTIRNSFTNVWIRVTTHGNQYAKLSCDTEEAWLHFDHELYDGIRAIDEFLDGARLGTGERAFLNAMS